MCTHCPCQCWPFWCRMCHPAPQQWRQRQHTPPPPASASQLERCVPPRSAAPGDPITARLPPPTPVWRPVEGGLVWRRGLLSTPPPWRGRLVLTWGGRGGEEGLRARVHTPTRRLPSLMVLNCGVMKSWLCYAACRGIGNKWKNNTTQYFCPTLHRWCSVTYSLFSYGMHWRVQYLFIVQGKRAGGKENVPRHASLKHWWVIKFFNTEAKDRLLHSDRMLRI